MDCSRDELNETVSCCAIYICTSGLSVTGPTTGLSNPCLDTQHLLFLVTDCSRGGESGTESHCAIYACTLRVSVTVLACYGSWSVQSSDWNETSSYFAIFICTSRLSATGPTTGLFNPCLNTQHLLSSVSCDCLLTWRRNWDRVSLCNSRLHFESVCDSPCYGDCPIL